MSAPGAPAPARPAPAGPAPEPELVADMVRRTLPFAPILVALAALPWGVAGAASTAYGIAIVVVNFLLAAYMLATAARIGYALLMAAALVGYLLRLGLIFLAVFAVRDAGWVEPVPLGMTLVLTHLGLLLWELRYVSASLAFPGLKPGATKETAAR